MESKTFEINPIIDHIALIVDAIEVMEEILFKEEELEEDSNIYVIGSAIDAIAELNGYLEEQLKELNQAIEFNRINPPANTIIYSD